MSKARKPNPAPPVGTSAAPGHDGLKEDPVERELDEALQDTFPASDPLPIPAEPDEPTEPAVDEALKETFPASDPVALPKTPAKRRSD